PGAYSNVLLQNAGFNAVLGSSARFDGSSGRLAVRALGAAGQFTIEAWIKPEIYKAGMALYIPDEILPGSPTLELMDEGGIFFALEGNAPPELELEDDSLFPAEEWRYVVLAYDAASSIAKVYVDGQLAFEMSYATASPADFTPGHMGAGIDVNSFYRGLIDEFAVYTNVLSEERILAHYATVIGPIISPQPEDAAIFSGNTATF